MNSQNKTQTPETEKEPPSAHQRTFTVVGIGASAGGLEALQSYLDNMPTETGMAYVVVMHLSSDHQSHLAEILETHTSLPVIQVNQSIQMAPDHIYVIPPNSNLSAIDTHLRLTELEAARQHRAPIDHFFRTLAANHGEHSIGIVLSGTGSDGSVGLKEIKEAGGLTVVQDPVEAAYDSMPQNAIATGQIDLILPVAEMPSQIQAFLRIQPQITYLAEAAQAPDTKEELLQRVFAELRARTDHDFSGYKRTTVKRRVRRRMQLQQIEELPAYLQLLETNQNEVALLCRDLLITVTSFFRDREAFLVLEQRVIPRLFSNRDPEESVRVWVTGCATGEEAYSVAMLLLETRSQLKNMPEIQIFATDISEEALARAREGFYPAAISADVSEERLQRFFTPENDGYRVKKRVRDKILFAEHNLLSDPPFSKLDLITCRNLLIYLQRELQHKVVGLFHYALKPQAFLFLGSSETVASAEHFQPINKGHGLYQRRAVGAANPQLPAMPLAKRRTPATAETTGPDAEESRQQDSFEQVHQEMVEQYAPPSILVNEDFIIVHLSQHAGRYLYQPGGEPTNNVLHRIRPELRTELTTTLYSAFEKDRASWTKPITVSLTGKPRQVSMSVHPATVSRLTGHVLIVFLEADDVTLLEGVEPEKQGTTTAMQTLEEELGRTKKQLQTAVEEYEASKEEMRASNEELQSMNEELRSTAEELETSKEELQSTNEELLTVNQEHKAKVDELSQLASDLQNLLATTDVAILFLDRDLTIRRFTPQVANLFNLINADQGRPLAHITHRLNDGNLLEDAGRVLENLAPVEREMRSQDDRHYKVSLRPYRSLDDRIEGVVITFVEVTSLKQTQEELRASNQFQEYIVNTVREGLLVMGLDLRVMFANDSFYEMFQVSRDEVEGTLIYNLGNKQWDIPELRMLLEEILPDNKTFNNFEVVHEFDQIGRRIMRLNGRRLDGQQRILLAIEDVTEQKKALSALKKLNVSLEDKVRQRSQRIQRLSSELLLAEQKARQRIAQALHDDLQQYIYSMRMQLKMVLDSLKVEERIEIEEVERLADLDKMMLTAFTKTRQMALELQPPVSGSENLTSSFHELADYIHELHGLHIDVVSRDEIVLTDVNLGQLMLRIAQELLFNVVKHANVDRATVEIAREANELKISILDKGAGFDTEAILRQGKRAAYGLYSINERLQGLNGRLEIKSVLNNGTRIDVFIPLRNETDFED